MSTKITLDNILIDKKMDMKKTQLLTLRTTESVERSIKKLTELEKRKPSDEARLIIEIGIKERLKQLAIEKYIKNEVTLEKAAEIAEISVWELLEILESKKIPYRLDVEAVTGR